MKPHRKIQRILWITDPWDTLHHPLETTVRLMESALNLGARCFWADIRSLRLEKGLPAIDAAEVHSISRDKRSEGIFFHGPKTSPLSTYDSVHYRLDPPVDAHYLHPLQISRLSGGKTRWINPIDVLFSSSEKYLGLLTGCLPPSFVGTQWDRLRDFGEKQSETVLKPLDQAQSKGVEILRWRSEKDLLESKAQLAKATAQFTRPVLLQKYLVEIEKGETRLWFVRGKVLGAVIKMPVPGDFRVNIDRGSRVLPARLTPKQQRTAKAISRVLKKLHVDLAAVDLIGEWISDFNFTSPGLLVQMEEVLQKDLATPTMRALLN